MLTNTSNFQKRLFQRNHLFLRNIPYRKHFENNIKKITGCNGGTTNPG